MTSADASLDVEPLASLSATGGIVIAEVEGPSTGDFVVPVETLLSDLATADSENLEEDAAEEVKDEVEEAVTKLRSPVLRGRRLPKSSPTESSPTESSNLTSPVKTPAAGVRARTNDDFTGWPPYLALKGGTSFCSNDSQERSA